MKKNQVNMILIDQTKRRNKIISSCSIILIVSIIALSSFLIFLSKNQTQYVKYKEKSELDYQVYLKENDFFDNKYLLSDNQYIASLINYIKADFKYNLSVEEKDIDYQYSYRIEADVTVQDKTTKKNLYHHTKELVESELKTSYSSSKVYINKSVDIDYNYYNDLIKRFVNIYGLEDTTSTLTINMYVTVTGDCEDILDADTESVISLSIPLTTKTVGIDMKYDLVDDNQEKIMICEKNDKTTIIFIIISVILMIIDIYLIIKLIIYIVDTRTAESIYDRELKKILNNYGSYIQKVDNSFELKNYQVLKINSFTDMLEIRDTVNEPILMVENKEKTGVYFVIPSHTKILYIYSLMVSDIKNKMEEKNNENF